MRISATTLEAYRRLIQTEYGDPEELVAQVKREPFTPRWQMMAGSAWHSCLEGKGVPWQGGKLLQMGRYFFTPGAVEAGRKLNGPGIWEVKATKQIGGATIVAQADHIGGLTIADNKTCFSQIDVKNYEPSLQWRLYCLIHDCPTFVYHCWDFKDPDGGGYCECKGVQSFRFWAYPKMEEDCCYWVRQFIAWADSKGLLPYLDREGTEIAA